ncbi:MAG: biopolymer transporter ExbD [Thermodesulfobacteriota bacterium]|nr:biopolymer transporter ExbD [Thermodesulfobacteriota bacterium]
MLNITSARRGRRETVDLNITPLIDMVFILLIFFLVNTSFVKETGVEVSRPTAATATTRETASILIAVDEKNRVFMEHQEIDVRAVRANVERALAENPESSVIVVADKGSDTGVAIDVMDGCRMAGAEDVSLAASLPGSP